MTTFCKRISRKLYKKVPTDDGRGITSKPDGSESAYIELDIDVDRIMAYLGDKAMRNRTGRARALNGLIIAKATKRERIPELSEEDRKAASALLRGLNSTMRDHLK